ncbi:hypothetical protein ACFLQK_02350 [bacterium]
MSGSPRIALVGAGGASFGPVMAYEAVCAEGLAGATLVLVDINEPRLETAAAAARRMNEARGNLLNIETETDTARGVEGADYVLLSVEVGRWQYWKQDLEVPRRYGSMQDMGENGGPGGTFHALRTISLVLKICELIEKNAPGALLINVTNPLSRVNLAVHRGTKIKSIGLCPELMLCKLKLARWLMIPPDRIIVRAAGLNHFTWIHGIATEFGGRNLYPLLKAHTRLFPLAHDRLVRRMYRESGLYPVSSDSHIGEYLPHTGRRSVLPQWFPYQQFSETECRMRVKLTELYADGKFDIPWKILPKQIEGGIDIIEALETKKSAHFEAVNVPNEGYIPYLPKEVFVEVPARAKNGELLPETMPPLPEPIDRWSQLQAQIHNLTVDAVLNRDSSLALEAFSIDPLAPPTREKSKLAFYELIELQKDVLPF